VGWEGSRAFGWKTMKTDEGSRSKAAERNPGMAAKPRGCAEAGRNSSDSPSGPKRKVTGFGTPKRRQNRKQW
jgi:hypothetical protein